MTDLNRKYVCYYRVSTHKQDLDTQKRIIRNHLQEEWIDKEFEEIVSGKTMATNQKLNEAVKYCKINNRTLAVAKHDRLGRNLAQAAAVAEELNWQIFIPNLAGIGQKINPAIFGMLMGMAELEREWISERTKEGLRTAREKGVEFGPKRKLSKKQIVKRNRDISITKHLQKTTDEKYQRIRDFILNRIKEWEVQSGRRATKEYGRNHDDIHQQVADELNALNFPLPNYLVARKNFTDFNSRFVANLFYEETRKVPLRDFDKELREDVRRLKENLQGTAD